jgi:hypothetical protein
MVTTGRVVLAIVAMRASEEREGILRVWGEAHTCTACKLTRSSLHVSQVVLVIERWLTIKNFYEGYKKIISVNSRF